MKPKRLLVFTLHKILFTLLPHLNLCTSSIISKSICSIHDISCLELCSIPKFATITFVDKFNEKYDNDLLSEQKDLLSHYITSFSDNSLELKIFLNEEINRLKEKLTTAKLSDEINSDSSMSDKTQQILDRLDGYSQETISENVIMTVLKTQQLVKEIFEDVDQD